MYVVDLTAAVLRHSISPVTGPWIQVSPVTGVCTHEAPGPTAPLQLLVQTHCLHVCAELAGTPLVPPIALCLAFRKMSKWVPVWTHPPLHTPDQGCPAPFGNQPPVVCPWTQTHAHPAQDSPCPFGRWLPCVLTIRRTGVHMDTAGQDCPGVSTASSLGIHTYTQQVLSSESPKTCDLWQLVRAPLVQPVAKSPCGLTLGHCPYSVLASRLLHLLAS